MYSFKEKNNIQILDVDDLLNPTDNQKIIEEVQGRIDGGQLDFIINLAPMDYINSSGLTFMISILTRARNAGGDVAVANLSDSIKKVLLITRLQSAFPVHDSLEEALAYFENNDVKQP